ncbi:MAG: hypothetical protein HYZ58_12055 [Acidobacteria bacterium]|nr:hypothetical protein [Acidobacteriota bacterium]
MSVVAARAGAPTRAATPDPGTIKGTVTTTAAPATGPIKVTINENVCGQTQPDPSVVVGNGGGLANGVVTISGTRASAATMITVTNQQCRFAPHVQVARPGATLRITSEDQILHTTHAYAEDERTLFNIALPLPSISFARPLERARLVRLACDTHPWMRGFVVLTEEIAAVTGPDGSFVLSNVPPGTHELRFWHERFKAAPQKVTVTWGGSAEVTISAQ